MDGTELLVTAARTIQDVRNDVAHQLCLGTESFDLFLSGQEDALESELPLCQLSSDLVINLFLLQMAGPPAPHPGLGHIHASSGFHGCARTNDHCFLVYSSYQDPPDFSHP
jgi:hypothetical protein